MRMPSIQDRVFWCAAAAVTFVALVVARDRFSFYDDEGMNLIKALMVARGAPLYAQVYSDQAPLYTWLLAAVIRLCGANYAAVRLVALAAGTGAVLAAAGVAAQLAGRTAAVICMALLLSWAPIQKFAGTIVINMPALALGSAAVLLALRSVGHRAALNAAGAGVLLALACWVKLATVYVLPIVGAAFVAGSSTPDRARARAALICLGAFFAAGAAIALFVPLRTALPQLITPHTTALGGYVGQSRLAREQMLGAPGLPFVFLGAACGLCLTALHARRRAATLVVWLAVTTFWMLRHRPLWAHHFPDFLVPVAIVSGTGCALAWRAFRTNQPTSWPLACGASVFLLLGTAIHVSNLNHWRRWYDGPSASGLRALADRIARETTRDEYILVDRPILAFWSDRRTPPGLALLVKKRINSGQLTESDLRSGLETFRPKLVVLCTDRLDRFVDFQAALDRDYLLLDRPLINTTMGRPPQNGPCRFMARDAGD